MYHIIGFLFLDNIPALLRYVFKSWSERGLILLPSDPLKPRVGVG